MKNLHILTMTLWLAACGQRSFFPKPLDLPMLVKFDSVNVRTNTVPKPVYHCTVVSFMTSAEILYPSYVIEFTNDNWLTKDKIKHSFNIGEAVLQEIIFSSRDEAVAYAKTLISYEKCIEVNKKAEAQYNVYAIEDAAKVAKEKVPTPVY